MAITAKQIKELREKTGAGMLDCKKALVETEGNIEKAIDFLRKKGIAKAEKKSGRIAAEGIVVAVVSDDKKSGVILEFNSETDFVAKEASFNELASKIAKNILENNYKTVEELKMAELEGKTIDILVKELIARIGENMNIRRFSKITSEDGFVSTYIHMGGKLGVILKAVGEPTEENQAAAKDVAMHIAAMSPKFLKRDEVSEEELLREKEIYREEMKNSGKPENIIGKIVDGKMRKYYELNCLVEQKFVKDSDKTITEFIKGKFDIVKYDKFVLGEGIEKKEENFAEEVLNQIK